MDELWEANRDSYALMAFHVSPIVLICVILNSRYGAKDKRFRLICFALRIIGQCNPNKSDIHVLSYMHGYVCLIYIYGLLSS